MLGQRPRNLLRLTVGRTNTRAMNVPMSKAPNVLSRGGGEKFRAGGVCEPEDIATATTTKEWKDGLVGRIGLYTRPRSRFLSIKREALYLSNAKPAAKL